MRFDQDQRLRLTFGWFLTMSTTRTGTLRITHTVSLWTPWINQTPSSNRTPMINRTLSFNCILLLLLLLLLLLSNRVVEFFGQGCRDYPNTFINKTPLINRTLLLLLLLLLFLS